MEHDLLSRAAAFLLEKRRKGRWRKAVSVMAMIVVFCTTYALILPAITLENDTICSLEEHTHTEDCYRTEMVYPQSTMSCSIETLGIHVHDGSCYDGAGNLVCGYADFVIHTHDQNCYSEDGSLICTLPEIEEHTHSRTCYTLERTLICGEEEDLGHSHSAACYTHIRGDLICTLEEEEGHTHDASCYATVGELTCDSEEEDHEHDDSCYTEELELICTQEEYEGHQHSDDCYEWTEELTCTQEERDPGHVHDDSCYETERVLDCDEDEVELHIHDEDCYDENGDLICGKLQLLAHQHTADCIQPPPEDAEPEKVRVLVCGLPEHSHDDACYPGNEQANQGSVEAHIHSEDCYDAEGSLICGQEELVLTEERLEAENPERVEDVIALIDVLPSSEEIEEQLNAFDEAGDDDGYEAYFLEVFQQVRAAYARYEDLGPELQELVTNRDKLLELEWLWSAMPMAITDTVTVYQINQYLQAVTTLVWGGSVSEKLGSGMSYTYWDVIVVEKDSSGKLYVAQYVTADGDKRSYKATTADGFVLLLYNTSVNAQVGDPVSVDFNYQTSGAYNAAGYGTVTFGTSSELKPSKDNSSKLSIVPGADTRELITVNLYDYGSNINTLYNSDRKYPGFQQDNGTKTVWSTASSNFGNNITSDLSAGIPGITNSGGAINATTNSANSPISGAMQQTLGSDGYPALADGTSLGYLFSDSTYATKQNGQSINGLFRYNDTTGAYTFNSRENHAQFNSKNDTFTLYNQIISSNFIMYPFGNFLPFNDIVYQSTQASTIDRGYFVTIASSAKYKYEHGYGAEYGTLASVLNDWIGKMDVKYPNGWGGAQAINEYFNSSVGDKNFDFTNETALLEKIYSIDYDEPTDFYFGMEMYMEFMQPKGGLTGKDGQQPMVFYFTGDDDVWVYVDGRMFLDLSGIHRHVGGEIDFVNGVVKYYDLDVSTGDVSSTPSKTVNFSDLVSAGLNSKGTFEDYSTHTFNFYYMERGAGSGVCRMNFNFPLLRQNSISVTKELSVDEADKLGLLGNPDFRFQVLKENSEELFIGDGVSYDILDATGKKIGSGSTDENGVFVLKANQTAVFSGIKENSGKYYVRELLDPDAFAQYGTIFVNGTSQTTNYDVTVGSDSFKGVNSPIKDVSDGSTVFRFNNQVIFKELGGLEITKSLETYPKARDVPQFQFYVTLDGEALPVGTKYSVGEETRTVAEAGVITLAPDETAVISNILAGSIFTVEECEASAEGYYVTYSVYGGAAGTSPASGIIKTGTSVAVTVNNGEKGASISIPVVKTLENPDGAEHIYHFDLEQVTDQSGSESSEPGFSQSIDITLTGDGAASSSFEIAYPQTAVSETPVQYYYKITEAARADGVTRFDESVYVVQVTVSKESGEVSADITAVWKDGEKMTPAEGETDAPEISFVNTLVGYELPSTGGAGTYLYTMGGLSLMAMACLMYIKGKGHRRKEVS